ncbi:hypothetical protein [Alkalihalobacillus sp. AL-G]|nr:hypothetical protein [Alkalihalobacillus sp. AL-G]
MQLAVFVQVTLVDKRRISALLGFSGPRVLTPYTPVLKTVVP